MLINNRNKLIIIGNGFDLAHKFETGYNHFITYLINKEIQHTKNKKFSNLLITKFNSNMNHRLINNYKNFNEIKIDIALNKFNILFKTKFFKELIYNFKDRWVDIEYFYYSKLLKLFRELDAKGLDYDKNIMDELEKINADFLTLKNSLITYLNSLNFTVDNLNATIKSHFDQLYTKLDSQKIYILNFNYTSVVENYLKSYENTQVNYIHGKLNDYENQIIFGYGDESDEFYSKIERLNNNELLTNFKSFSYFKNNNYNNLNNFISNEEFDVHIMGHSCGISDRVLFKEILNRSNCKEIKLYYYKYPEGGDDFFQKTMEISRHFLPDKKHEMRLKINKLTSTPLT